MALVIKYTLFAFIATVANILCQDVINRLNHGQYDLYLSMIQEHWLAWQRNTCWIRNISSHLKAKACFRMVKNLLFILQWELSRLLFFGGLRWLSIILLRLSLCDMLELS